MRAMKIPVFRVRICPEGGYYDECSMTVLGPPEGADQVCIVYKHDRRDLKIDKALSLKDKIEEAGCIDLTNGWTQTSTVPYENLADK